MNCQSHPNLAEVPEELGEMWQVHTRKVLIRSVESGALHERWCILVVSATTDSLVPDRLIVSYDIVEVPPTSEQLWEKLSQAILVPRWGRPRRPGTVEFRCEQYYDALRSRLKTASIRPAYRGTLRRWESVFLHISNGILAAATPAAVFATSGIPAGTKRRFFASAAGFYEQLPYLPQEAVIDVRRDGRPNIRWYGLVHRRFPDEPALTLIEAESPSQRRFSSLKETE